MKPISTSHILPFLAALFTTLIMSAQDAPLEWFKHMDMRHVGPGTMSGRVTAIDVVRDQPNVIYVGTASGGLWKSTSGGITWEPVFDDQPVQSIGAVAIAPSNPDVIWAGTGEGNPRNSHNSGEGVFKSSDGGATWQLMGLQNTRNIHRIVVHRDDPNTVIVGATGSAWGESEDRGVYRTTDGGKNWEKVLFINDETGCADLIVDPVNPDKIFAAMWQHSRKPWTFNSGGDGSGLYVSHDAGATWTERTDKNGLPDGELGRIGLAISAANANVVYALVEAKKTGLYKSTDGGRTFNLVSTKNIGNRPFYYAEIYAHPGDENTLFNLYSLVSKSIDGGKTFDVILPYSGVHPDHHAFYIHPDDHNFMINGNDGGLNISRDGGENWEFIMNLPLGQFYHINYDMEVPYNVYGGMQDNGSWKGPGYVWHYGGIRNEDWQEISFGDGFDVVPDRSDNRFAYAMYQGGNVYRVNHQTGEMAYVKPVSSDSVNLRFNWNAAIAADPRNNKGIYFGSQRVHYSFNQGQSWMVLSPDLTTNDTTKQKQAESGGLTIDATQAENFTTILCIEPSPFDDDVIWVGTDDGKLQLTRNGGKVWQDLAARLPDLPEGSWIPQLVASTHNRGELFVVANNYRRNDWQPYLYHTSDFGVTWKRLADNNKVHGHCLAVVQDPEEPNLLFLGTDRGLYVSFDKGAKWNKWEHNYPSVSTRDLKIHPREHDLIIGTFGRGCYILDDIRPLREAAAGGLGKPLQLFEPVHAYLHPWKRAQGARFIADHHWSGENKRSGAALSWFVHPDSLDTKEKETKATLHIIAEAGDTLRTLRLTPDSGVTRSAWGLREKGVLYPARRSEEPEDEPGGGPPVLPGVYKAVLTYKEMKDSAMITVLPDPRMAYEADNAAKAADHHRELMETVSKARKAFDRIRDAQEVIGMVKQQIALQEDTTLQELMVRADSLMSELKKLETLFMTAEDFEGYDHVTMRLNDYLYRAMSFVGPFDRAPGQNARRAADKAQEQTDEVLATIRAFFDERWSPWQEEIEKVELSPFRKLKPQD